MPTRPPLFQTSLSVAERTFLIILTFDILPELEQCIDTRNVKRHPSLRKWQDSAPPACNQVSVRLLNALVVSPVFAPV